MAETRTFSVTGKFVDNLSPGIRKAQTAFTAFGSLGVRSVAGISNALTSLRGLMLTVGSAFVGSRVLGSMVALADRIGNLRDKSRALGVTTEALSELAFALDQVGGSSEDAGPALSKLTKTIGQIRGGGNDDARKAFRELGITLSELSTSRPDAVLFRVADAMQGLGDETLAADYASRIFGRGVADNLLPVLMQGSGEMRKAAEEARRLGISVGSDQAEKLDTFSDAWKKLKETLSGLFRDVVAVYAPKFTEWLDSLSNWVSTNKASVLGFFEELGQMSVWDVTMGFSGMPNSRTKKGAEVPVGKPVVVTATPLPEQSAWEKGFEDFTSGFAAKLASLKNAWTDFAKAGEDAADRLVGGGLTKLTDSLTDIVTGAKSAKEAFRELAMNMGREIVNITIKLGIMAAIKSIAGLANGGVMRGQMTPVKGYAAGGIARSPQVAVFGEGKNAEAFVPLPDGRTIPVTMTGGGRGATVVNISALDARSFAEFIGRSENARVLWALTGAGIQNNSDLRTNVRLAAR